MYNEMRKMERQFSYRNSPCGCPAGTVEFYGVQYRIRFISYRESSGVARLYRKAGRLSFTAHKHEDWLNVNSDL